MPVRLVISSTSCSSSTSRNPCAPIVPVVGSESRYRAEAYLAVFSANSALVPPTTIARWYGGRAAGARGRGFLSRDSRMGGGAGQGLVCLLKDGLVARAPAPGLHRDVAPPPAAT